MSSCPWPVGLGTLAPDQSFTQAKLLAPWLTGLLSIPQSSRGVCSSPYPPPPVWPGLSRPEAQADTHFSLILPELLCRQSQGSADLSSAQLSSQLGSFCISPPLPTVPTLSFSSPPGRAFSLKSRGLRVAGQLVTTRGKQHLRTLSLESCCQNVEGLSCFRLLPFPPLRFPLLVSDVCDTAASRGRLQCPGVWPGASG